MKYYKNIRAIFFVLWVSALNHDSNAAPDFTEDFFTAPAPAIGLRTAERSIDEMWAIAQTQGEDRGQFERGMSRVNFQPDGDGGRVAARHQMALRNLLAVSVEGKLDPDNIRAALSNIDDAQTRCGYGKRMAVAEESLRLMTEVYCNSPSATVEGVIAHARHAYARQVLTGLIGKGLPIEDEDPTMPYIAMAEITGLPFFGEAFSQVSLRDQATRALYNLKGRNRFKTPPQADWLEDHTAESFLTVQAMCEGTRVEAHERKAFFDKDLKHIVLTFLRIHATRQGWEEVLKSGAYPFAPALEKLGCSTPRKEGWDSRLKAFTAPTALAAGTMAYDLETELQRLHAPAPLPVEKPLPVLDAAARAPDLHVPAQKALVKPVAVPLVSHVAEAGAKPPVAGRGTEEENEFKFVTVLSLLENMGINIEQGYENPDSILSIFRGTEHEAAAQMVFGHGMGDMSMGAPAPRSRHAPEDDSIVLGRTSLEVHGVNLNAFTPDILDRAFAEIVIMTAPQDEQVNMQIALDAFYAQ